MASVGQNWSNKWFREENTDSYYVKFNFSRKKSPFHVHVLSEYEQNNYIYVFNLVKFGTGTAVGHNIVS